MQHIARRAMPSEHGSERRRVMKVKTSVKAGIVGELGKIDVPQESG
jgi:hypothetical protein